MQTRRKEKVNLDQLPRGSARLTVLRLEQIISDLAVINIKCAEIGYVDSSNQVNMIYDGEEKKSILPQFRESAYTKIKQEVGDETPESKLEMEKQIEKAATQSLEKRKKIIDYIRKQSALNV